MNFKLGRKPVVHTAETLYKGAVLSAALDKLGRPPMQSAGYSSAVMKATGGDWGVDGNDTLGDCTAADCSHQHMLWTANTGAIEVPTRDQTVGLYEHFGYDPSQTQPDGSNPTDQGANIAAVCAFIERTGYMGNNLAGYADVSPYNLDHARWGVELFGTIKLGINLPKTAFDQFGAGHWRYVAGAEIEGGHDVCAVDYVNNVWYVVSWGKLITMGPAFFNHYVEEIKVPLAINWCREGGIAPNRLNLSQLSAELAWEGPVY